jgi:cytochrome c oxidase cbb3-type subunit 3
LDYFKNIALIAMAGMYVVLYSAIPTHAQTPQTQVFSRDTSWSKAYSQGMALFKDNCATCHGEEGFGGIGEDALGLPLNLQSFLTIAPKEYIVKTIKFGRGSRGMPPFEEDFTPEQIDAVATFIKGWQIQPTKIIETGKINGDVKEGGEWYKVICGNCHGPNGEGGPQETGGGHISASFSGFSAPSLADSGFKKSATDGFIKATLIYGRVGTPMTSYLKGNQGHVELEEKDIDDIVAYIRELPPIE